MTDAVKAAGGAPIAAAPPAPPPAAPKAAAPPAEVGTVSMRKIFEQDAIEKAKADEAAATAAAAAAKKEAPPSVRRQGTRDRRLVPSFYLQVFLLILTI